MFWTDQKKPTDGLKACSIGTSPNRSRLEIGPPFQKIDNFISYAFFSFITKKITVGPLHSRVDVGRHTPPPGQIVRISGIHLSFDVVVAPIEILSAMPIK